MLLWLICQPRLTNDVCFVLFVMRNFHTTMAGSPPEGDILSVQLPKQRTPHIAMRAERMGGLLRMVNYSFVTNQSITTFNKCRCKNSAKQFYPIRALWTRHFGHYLQAPTSDSYRCRMNQPLQDEPSNGTPRP